MIRILPRAEVPLIRCSNNKMVEVRTDKTQADDLLVGPRDMLHVSKMNRSMMTSLTSTEKGLLSRETAPRSGHRFMAPFGQQMSLTPRDQRPRTAPPGMPRRKSDTELLSTNPHKVQFDPNKTGRQRSSARPPRKEKAIDVLDWAKEKGHEQTALRVRQIEGVLRNPSHLALIYSSTTPNHILAQDTLRINHNKETSQLIRIKCIEHRLQNQRTRRLNRQTQLDREKEKLELKFKVDEHLRTPDRLKELEGKSTHLLTNSEKLDIRQQSIHTRTQRMPFLKDLKSAPVKSKNKNKKMG
ncbi:hypothetical protein CAPTEDRAFT_215727 [Capitella teleta]|uniref:Uncharacterized protein n=1 Tax=Capitella teleta TaxID=283909 RepID=R7TMA1_CAPTE|nr:hypothetical protein CAPTEDRAFT_215727 [Capitella teleta]|eukprot:ELT92686.1 hypothetical protein CAPTEDRAFT_215727 [Capitella teleta]